MNTTHQNEPVGRTERTLSMARTLSVARTLLTAAFSVTRLQAPHMWRGLAALTAIVGLSLASYVLIGNTGGVFNIFQSAPIETAALVADKPTDQMVAPLITPETAAPVADKPTDQMVAPLITPETAAPVADKPADQVVAPLITPETAARVADKPAGQMVPPSADVSAVFAPLPKPERQTPRISEAPISPAAATRDRLDELADRFIRFDHALNVAARSRLNTPAEVRRVLKNLRFPDAEEIAQGWYASRAIIAAQDPDFIRGVRDELNTYGVTAMTAQLQGHGSYARNISGAQSATVSVLDTIATDNRKMADLSKRFLTAAREFQSKKWGALDPLPGSGPGPDAAPSKHAHARIGDMLTELAGALNELAGITPAHAYAPSTMERILALGARRVIGATWNGADNSAALLTDQKSSKCLRWARLNLNQCLAAAHFPSEEAWCTGKHAIEDVRACWAQALPPRISASTSYSTR